MNSSQNKHKGFSLLEVLIAIAILAISLLSLFSLQSTSLLSTARAERLSLATQLAGSKMSQAIVDIEKGIPKGEFPEDKSDSGTFEEQKFPEYSWNLTIKTVELPTPPLPEGAADIMGEVLKSVSEQISKSTREVKLIVSYNDGDGEPQELITLTTHVVKMN